MGFASWLRYRTDVTERRSTKLCTMFGRLLRWYTVYTFSRALARYRYSLLINIDKTKVMASDGIACRILIQNEQLAQVNTFPYLGSLIMVSVRQNSVPG